jgi:hypothetical protein
MATEEKKATGFKLGKGAQAAGTQDGKGQPESTTETQNTGDAGNSDSAGDDSSAKSESTEQNVGGEPGGFKQVDQAATTLADNADSANNNNDTNAPGKGAAPSDEGTTGEHPDNGPEATQERLDQSNDLSKVGDEDQVYDRESTQAQTFTAEDAGVDTNANRDPITEAAALFSAADSGVSAEADEVVYSSHPIQNYQVGPYHFEGTVLKLNREQSAEFDKLLDSMPLTERRNVSKIDSGKVAQIVENRLGGATQQFDSSAGRDALERLRRENPMIGTQAIDGPTAHANLPQQDQNTDIPLNQFDAKFNG